MPPENDQQIGQEPTIEPQAPQDGGSEWEAERAKLRQEAAKWRTQLRETEGKLKELEPAAARLQELEEANKTEAEKMAERLAALEGKLTEAQTQAQRAAAERKLTVLATKAGVPADMLQYLDVSKFDLDNEEEALKALSALVPTRQATTGSASNPARGTQNGTTSLEEWYSGAGKKNYIFGDK